MPDASLIKIVGVSEGAYYTPQIVAAKLGFFADEGIEIEYAGYGDVDGLAGAVQRGRADIALGGLWRPLLFSQVGVPFVAFAQASMQCDLLVFGRKPKDEFDWSTFSDGSILTTSVGAPSPWFALQEVLRRRGVDLNRLHVIGGLPPAEARAWFDAGVAAAIEVSDADALPYLDDEKLFQIVSWAEDLGSVPWSVYYSTPEWLGRRRAEAEAVTRALARAQAWLSANEVETIAEVVQSYFPDLALQDCVTLVRTYRNASLWPSDPQLARTNVEHWVSILRRGGLLGADVSIDAVVDWQLAADALAK